MLIKYVKCKNFTKHFGATDFRTNIKDKYFLAQEIMKK